MDGAQESVIEEPAVRGHEGLLDPEQEEAKEAKEVKEANGQSGTGVTVQSINIQTNTGSAVNEISSGAVINDSDLEIINGPNATDSPQSNDTGAILNAIDEPANSGTGETTVLQDEN